MFERDPSKPAIEPCKLCGYAVRAQLVYRLARYRSPDEPFRAIMRCIDTDACRERIEKRGQRWPLREAGEPTSNRPAPGPGLI